MSNRSMLEFNHDYCPYTDEEKQEFLTGLLHYMTSGDVRYLPRGVTWFGMRHHSEPCPLKPPRGWNNETALGPVRSKRP